MSTATPSTPNTVTRTNHRRRLLALLGGFIAAVVAAIGTATAAVAQVPPPEHGVSATVPTPVPVSAGGTSWWVYGAIAFAVALAILAAAVLVTRLRHPALVQTAARPI